MNLDERAINIFTDGSSYSTPRRGGAGLRIITVDDDGHEVVHDEVLPGHRSGTNQEMELVAVIEALQLVGGRHSPVELARFDKVVILTDSTYVASNFSAARFKWPTTGWMTREGNPVVNAALWKDLTRAAAKVGKRVEIEWHHGHSAKNPHNRAADKLAKQSAKGHLLEPVSISRVRRKTTAKKTELGSIVPRAQRITIKVITDRWLKPQRMYQYKIEVVSKKSPYYGNVDNFFSEILLNAGHTYFVKLNDDPRAPRIERLYHEVEGVLA